MLKRINLYFKRRNTYNQTVKELGSLSNNELKDIGISRSDIPYLAREMAAKYI